MFSLALKDDRTEQYLRSCGCEFQMSGPKQEKTAKATSLAFVLLDFQATSVAWAIQAGLLTPLTFALLKSLSCFYFRCVLSSQWKAVTVNLRILHCQL